MITQPIPTSFPCPTDDIFSLPTKEELVSALNDILSIPSKLKAELAKAGSEIAEEVRQQIEDVIKEIEGFVEKLESLLSPYWQKLSVRDWQKEANEAITKFIQDFHIYIPAKILEIITSLVPVDFNLTLFGIKINILKIFTAEEQAKVQAQIVEKIDSIKFDFEKFTGEFSIKCDEWRAKMTWQYIKVEIIKYLTNTAHAVFGKLIKIFEEIWDLLGLDALVSLLTLNFEELINNGLESIKKRYGDLKERTIEEIKEFKQECRDFLDTFTIGGFDILKMIGGDIRSNVESFEQEIAEKIVAIKEFEANWQKKLLFEWVKKVKKFFDAIGIGKIFDFLMLTFCDFLTLMGFPKSIDLNIPAIGGVLAVSSYKPKIKVNNNSVEARATDLYDADGETTDFNTTGSGSELKVFIDGVKQNPSTYSIHPLFGNKIVFDVAPEKGTVTAIKYNTDV